MQKLIMESSNEYQTFIESAGEGNPPKFFIEGKFAQANLKNVNGRIYPFDVLKEAVDVYNDKFVSRRRALGELGHPPTTTINENRVSHLIEEIRADGSDFIGRAKILSTPMGEIVKTFIREGVKMAVSTRGLGQMKRVNEANEIQPGFKMVTIDIVTDPSGPDCFVNGIMEATEFFYDNASGNWVAEQAMDKVMETIHTPEKHDPQAVIRAFDAYLSALKS